MKNRDENGQLKGVLKDTFFFFLQQFASDSWRRFTRQRLNPPVCSRDASAFGSDDFSWHELGGEPINKGNMEQKGGDN